MAVHPVTKFATGILSASNAVTCMRVAIGAAAAACGALAGYWLTDLGDSIVYLAFLPLVLAGAIVGGAVSAIAGASLSVLLASVLFRSPENIRGAIDALAFAGAAIGLPVLAGLIREKLALSPRAAITLAEQVSQLNAIVDDARDGVFLLDSDCRVLSANKAGLGMFQRMRDEVVTCDFASLFADTLFLPERAGAKQNATLTTNGRRLNGETFPAEVIAKSHAFGQSSVTVAFVFDLSESAKNRQRLEKLTLERLSGISGIMASLAHEINQPLTAAAAYLNAGKRLLARQPVQDSAVVAETVEKAAAQIVRAAQTLRDLRELVAWGEPDKTLVSVSELIDETLALIAPFARDAHITIRKEFGVEDDLIVADRVQIKQVLLNIVRNAIEAMHGSSRRELVISTTMVEPGAIRVEIHDTGPGFLGVEEAELFEPFMTTKKKGMGIGLSMCRVIVEAHYGQLWALQNPDSGATFGLDLPLREKEPNA